MKHIDFIEYVIISTGTHISMYTYSAQSIYACHNHHYSKSNAVSFDVTDFCVCVYNGVLKTKNGPYIISVEFQSCLCPHSGGMIFEKLTRNS